jgi:hypothetical protein
MSDRPISDRPVNDVASYKTILRDILDRRPSGTRQRLAHALGTNRSFVTQITNPAYPVPIPSQHIPVLFEICHPSPVERAAFLETYARAHPGRLEATSPRRATRPLTVTVPDLGDDARNAVLDALVTEMAARLACFAEDIGGHRPRQQGQRQEGEEDQ